MLFEFATDGVHETVAALWRSATDSQAAVLLTPYQDGCGDRRGVPCRVRLVGVREPVCGEGDVQFNSSRTVRLGTILVGGLIAAGLTGLP